MKVVYICHPFRGDIAGDRERVQRIGAAVKREDVPLAPHLMLWVELVRRLASEGDRSKASVLTGCSAWTRTTS